MQGLLVKAQAALESEKRISLVASSEEAAAKSRMDREIKEHKDQIHALTSELGAAKKSESRGMLKLQEEMNKFRADLLQVPPPLDHAPPRLERPSRNLLKSQRGKTPCISDCVAYLPD